MTKKRIILFSILISLLALIIILFGAVFCLRKTKINTINATEHPLTITQTTTNEEGVIEYINKDITESMLLKATGLKKGKSIFAINKNKIISNIETEYPSIKVVNIKTTSLVGLQISVRQRLGLYYVEVFEKAEFSTGEGYYILDEELVIVNKLNKSDKVEEALQHYTKLSFDNKVLSGKPYYARLSSLQVQNYTSNLFKSVCSVVKIKDNQITNTDGSEYVERNNFPVIIKNVGVYKAVVVDNLQDLANDIYWLVLTTNSGVNIKILRPDKDLTLKVNYCFSALPQLTNDNNVIVCSYNEAGEIYLYQTK